MIHKTWKCPGCSKDLGSIISNNLVITSSNPVQRINTNGVNIVVQCNCGALKTWYSQRSALLDQLFIEFARMFSQGIEGESNSGKTKNTNK